MKLVKCDNHPDRDAVVTLRIIKLPTIGFRPILIGYAAGGKFVDLCEECATHPSFEEFVNG